MLLLRYQKRIFFLAFCFLAIFLLISTYFVLDPDFGWHLRMGQIILAKGIPQKEPFAYTMPNYPFVDHEWLTNVFLAGLFPHVGFNGLRIIIVFFALGALLLQAVSSEKNWRIIPVLLAGAGMTFFMGIRPQVMSWLFVSVLLLLLRSERLWQKLRWFLPVFFMLWVNLHGSFSLGIALLIVSRIAQWVSIKKVSPHDCVIIVLSFLATFVNPYQERIWWEIWMQASDGGLRWSIVEWFPSLFTVNYEYILLLPLSVMLVFRYRSRYSLQELTLYSFLLLLTLSSSRHEPFWFLIAIPLTASGFSYFYTEVKKNKFSLSRFSFVYTLYASLSVAMVLLHFGLSLYTINFGKVSPLATYPDNAITFLKVHPSDGNIFSEYGWGGYLDWQLPEKKVFIDGRMPSFRQQCPQVGESADAFKDYQALMHGDLKTMKSLFIKYHIDTVLWEQTHRKFAIQQYDLTDRSRFLTNLSKLGFHIIYQDSVSVVYRKG